MATITFKGLDEYRKELEQILDRVPKMVNASLYDGADVLADAVQSEISGLNELDAVQKKGLHDGLGVAHFWTKAARP